MIFAIKAVISAAIIVVACYWLYRFFIAGSKPVPPKPGSKPVPAKKLGMLIENYASKNKLSTQKPKGKNTIELGGHQYKASIRFDEKTGTVHYHEQGSGPCKQNMQRLITNHGWRFQTR